jgi:small subunit ribosomal protein S6
MPSVIRHIAEILERCDAEIERMEQWEERKLAYPIGNAKRGIYILTYYRADGSQIRELRHLVRLSEDILRALVLRTDEMDPVTGQLYSPGGEEIEEAEAVAVSAPAEPETAADEGSEEAETE